jgi:hypothetical protein
MAEKEDENSFTKRFTRGDSDGGSSGNTPGGGFASKYSSVNTKKQALGTKGKISELASKSPAPQQAFSDSAGVKRTKKEEETDDGEGSLAKRLRKSRSDLIYLVRGRDRGRAAWHYVLVDKEKREIFLAKSRTGSMDVADYGEILYSGWGEDPSQDIIDKINEEFGL